jgi:hypothetical protein
MSIKVQPDSFGLCSGCRHSHIIETVKGVTVFCMIHYSPAIQIKAPILRCNEFEDKSQPTVQNLEKIAWVLCTDKSKKIGFKPWKEFKKMDDEDGD